MSDRRARRAVLVGCVCSLAVAAAPAYNPGGGWVRLLLALASVSAVLLAYALTPELSYDAAWDRHVRRCPRCSSFAGDCAALRRLQHRYDARSAR